MSRSDPRVRVGTEAHYRDAAYYDRAYGRRREDVRFYAELAEERGGPVLELGVGTGRVALELGRRGVEVVGVDTIEEMLARADERLAREKRAVRERIALRRADLRTLRLRRRFPLVIAPFNVFMHLYSRQDWERALRAAHRHLRPSGRLVFDVLLPDPAELARDPARTYRAGHVTRPEDGKRYRYGESFEYDPATQIELITMQFQDESDPAGFFVTPLAHRQVFPRELEALLHYNGFTVEHHWGGFDRSALGPTSDSQVIVARPRRQRAATRRR